MNSPLLSRSRVLILDQLGKDHIRGIVKRAIEDKDQGVGSLVSGIEDDALNALVSFSSGDARKALNTLELAVMLLGDADEGDRTITLAHIEEAAQQKTLRYDRDGEEHYNIISAMHKSMRGSDPDAAMYWFCRMLEGGEDPLYIARRVVRFASEDIGNADPQALQVSLAAMESYRFLGTPEGELAIAQAILHCATAPKSNSVYTAYKKARRDARKFGTLPVPLHIRNAPTRLMKQVGYGKGYKYDHDSPDSYSGQEHLPDKLVGTTYYSPSSFGHEKLIAERLKWWAGKKKGSKQDKSEND